MSIAIVNGAVPVSITLITVAEPLQIVVVPLIFAVGLGFTVTETLPEISATLETQLLWSTTWLML